MCYRGTSVEMAASRVGIAWGICKFSKFWTWEDRCAPIQPYTKYIQAQSWDEWDCSLKKLRGSSRHNGAHPWHCPPMKYAGQIGVNKFEGVDTFTIVRNPYSLMIR